MAGREGLVDTAVKTAETGYMQVSEDVSLAAEHQVFVSVNCACSEGVCVCVSICLVFLFVSCGLPPPWV
jgi:hypothetical protein